MNTRSLSNPNVSTCGVAVLNGDGTIRYCNDLLLCWINATPKQCEGKSITTYFPDLAAEITVESVATVNTPKFLQLQPSSGGLESVRITVRPLDLDGQSSLIVVVEHSDGVVEPARRRGMAQLRTSAEVRK